MLRRKTVNASHNYVKMSERHLPGKLSNRTWRTLSTVMSHESKLKNWSLWSDRAESDLVMFGMFFVIVSEQGAKEKLCSHQVCAT